MRAVKDGQSLEIVRHRRGVLWCPFCDYSSMDNRSACKCGAEFVEDPASIWVAMSYDVDVDWTITPDALQGETVVMGNDPLPFDDPEDEETDNDLGAGYPCQSCSRTFSSRRGLSAHIRQAHPQEVSE